MGRPSASPALARCQPGCAHCSPGLVVLFCLGRTRTRAGMGTRCTGVDCVGCVYRRPAIGRAGGHAIPSPAPHEGAPPFPLALPSDPDACGPGRSSSRHRGAGGAPAGESSGARHRPGGGHADVFLGGSFTGPDSAGGVAALHVFFARILDRRAVHGRMPAAGGFSGGAGSVCAGRAAAGLAGGVFRRAGVAQRPCDRTLGVGSF